MVHHQLGQHLEAAALRLAHEVLEVGHRAVLRMHAVVVGDVVAVVLERRRIEGQQPQRRDAQILDVVELRGKALEVAHAVVVRVEERLDVHLVYDRVLVPERLLGDRGDLRRALRGHPPPPKSGTDHVSFPCRPGKKTGFIAARP
jgi:hypothetical protein